MIITGSVVLAFLGVHFYDFWIPEMNYKYIEANALISDRYYEELLHKFESLPRTILYCVSFLLLSVHLWHGFNSSFQSVGFNNKYSKSLKTFAYAFSIVVPALFVFIALFHHFNN